MFYDPNGGIYASHPVVNILFQDDPYANVPELRQPGAKVTVLIMNSYDEGLARVDSRIHTFIMICP